MKRAGEVMHGRGLVGQQRWMAQVNVGDRGAEPDAPRLHPERE